MVAHLLRLKLALLRNGLRRSPWQLAGMVLAALYALGVVATLVLILVALRSAPHEAAYTAVVLGGTAAIGGWGIVPVVAAATDLTLDPSRFTTFAVPMTQLLAGLALAGLLGVPGLATLLVALATVATWSTGIVPALAAVAGALLGVAGCIILAKVVTTATAGLAASRRFKDASGLAFLVPLVVLVPVLAVLAKEGQAPAFLPGLARVLSWTPLGAAWSVGGDASAGLGGAAALKLLIAAATVAGLTWCWKALLERALVTPPFAGSAKRGGGHPGLLGAVPAVPAAAVMARCLTYWVKDPRYSGSLAVIPLLPLVLYFQGVQTGDFDGLVILPPLVAFILAWSISADVSYDNTAFALHLATGVSGAADRLGRVLACLAFALPVVLAFGVGQAALNGSWTGLPGLLGLSVGILLTGLGLSSVVSARYTVAVPLPGDSPFKKPPGNVAQTLAVQLIGMALLGVLVLPEAVLFVAEVTTGNHVLGWANLAAGPLLGLALLAGGVRLGGRWLEARGPELLAQVAVNR
ncbi:transporter [Pseudarthrobacter sp. NPDC058362]|uniref:transporter n=1 Tax=Pseudarthrobacter sp. NPDC058362 TaxID=3346458 RepID=UPI003652547F